MRCASCLDQAEDEPNRRRTRPAERRASFLEAAGRFEHLAAHLEGAALPGEVVGDLDDLERLVRERGRPLVLTSRRVHERSRHAPARL